MSDVVNSKAEINTNMTMVELKGKVVNDLTPLSDTERDFAIATIEKFILDEGRPRFVTLLSNAQRYYTTFELSNADTLKTAKDIVEFIETEEFFKQFGTLKLVELESSHVEIWVGKEFFALFNYDSFIVEL